MSSPHENDVERPLPGDSESAPGMLGWQPNEACIRTFLRQSRDGIVIVDGQGTILEWNEGEAAITGVSRLEALGRPIWEVQHRLAPSENKNAESLNAIREKVLRGLREGVDLERFLEDTIERPDGARRCIQTILFGLRSGDQVLAGGICRDITDRKEAERALATAARRKDEFLAVLSHELRNPVAAIRAGLYVLSRTDDRGEQARSMFEILDRQVCHLSRLIDDLLDITRISEGKIKLRRERIELGDLVGRTLEDHLPAFMADGIHVEGRAALRPMWVLADPTRVAQILGNLLDNARKFTPRGGRVEVALQRDGEEAVLRVRDTGVGIAPEGFDRLFQAFMQADRTLDRARGGLGLGLALVKGLTELHGGSVSAASEGAGRGAEFTVRLPLEVAPAEAVAERESRPAAPCRVLIIEDNKDAADSLGAALALDGHQVEVAYDGFSGIEAARRFRPDCLVCDIGLPGMNGFEVARAFRSDDTLKHIRLIALTGYALPEDLQRAQEAGFDRHLAKPADIKHLQALLAGMGTR